MEMRPSNGYEPEDNDTESASSKSDKPKRHWPSKAADFLQSWRERLFGGKEEYDETQESGSSGWLRRIGRAAFRSLGISSPDESKFAGSDDVAAEMTSAAADEETETEAPAASHIHTDNEAPVIHESAQAQFKPESDMPEGETSPGADMTTVAPETAATYNERRQPEPEPTAAESPSPKSKSRRDLSPSFSEKVFGGTERRKISKLKRRTDQLEEGQAESSKQQENLQVKYDALEEQMREIARKMDVSAETRGDEIAESAAPPKSEERLSDERPTVVFERQTRQSPLERPRLEPLELEQLPTRELTQPEAGIPSPEPRSSRPEAEIDPYKIAGHEATPDIILEKVEEAAEKNVPLEALYERRQEVKDKDAIAGSAGPLSSLGQKSASPAAGWSAPAMPPEPHYGNYRSQPMVQASAGNKAAQLWSQQPEAYKRAISYSAATALMVTLVAAAIMAATS